MYDVCVYVGNLVVNLPMVFPGYWAMDLLTAHIATHTCS